MSSVFGFVSARKRGHNLSINELQMAATAAAARGPHAWGIVSLQRDRGGDGVYNYYREVGSVSNMRAELEKWVDIDTEMVLGHCLYKPTAELNSEFVQPVQIEGRSFFAHDGAVEDLAGIQRDYELDLETNTGAEAFGKLSEVALSLVDDGSGAIKSWMEQALKGAARVFGQGPCVAVWMRNGELAMYRRSSNLWVAKHPEGIYFSSVKWDTLIEPSMIPEDDGNG